MNTEPLYELRVLSGEQRGASSVMQPGQTLRIGQDWSSEVVLQQAQGSAVLAFSAEGGLVLQAEQGDCTVAEHALLPGGSDSLDLYIPFSVGGVRMAVGKMGASQWAGLFDGNVVPQSEPMAHGDSAHAEDALPSEAATATPSGDKVAPLPRRSWTSRLMLAGTALVGVSVCTLTLAWAMGPSTLSPQEQAVNIRQTLSHLGLTALNVESRNGQLFVTGHLESQAERTRLEKALADRSPARLSVWVNEQVAASVAEVYRLNGVAAEVRATGPGVVRVQTAISDSKLLEHVQSAARRDVPGLKQLVAANEAPPVPPPAASAINDPGKRVAAIVPGEPAYLVTVDGTRYFEGAMLPSGHRIVSILPDKVQMERDGVGSVLAF
jgi:type III secretion protein D